VFQASHADVVESDILTDGLTFEPPFQGASSLDRSAPLEPTGLETLVLRPRSSSSHFYLFGLSRLNYAARAILRFAFRKASRNPCGNLRPPSSARLIKPSNARSDRRDQVSSRKLVMDPWATAKVRWNTSHGETDQPIRTRPSISYRSHNMLAKPLVAEVSFNLTGLLSEDDDNRLIVSSGGTCIRLMWEESDPSCTECHFDIHPNKKGHPTLHTQFVGEVKELPRLISFFAHPLDILEFVLMEVFQDRWRRVRAGVVCKAQLHNYPTNQRTRLISVLQRYTGWLQAGDDIAPLVSLQATPTPPFDLYP
jgi:hypothetical protein